MCILIAYADRYNAPIMGDAFQKISNHSTHSHFTKYQRKKAKEIFPQPTSRVLSRRLVKLSASRLGKPAKTTTTTNKNAK